MLKLAFEGGYVQKVGSWNPGIPRLQYVGDIILLLPPDILSIKRVKILIYIFELFRGFLSTFISHLYTNLGPKFKSGSGL